MRLGIGFGLMVIAALAGALLDRTALRNLGYGSAVLMVIVGTLFYYFGLADLLKAKGYSGAIVIAIVVLGFCVPLVSAFIMTPVVLFALEDKNRRHGKHESLEIAALVLGYLHIVIGIAATVGSLAGIFVGRFHDPLWMDFGRTLAIGILPLWSGYLLIKTREPFSRIAGCLLIEMGVILTSGFLMFESSGGSSVRPFWGDLITILVVGVFPLAIGILMFQRRYLQVERAVKYVLGGCIAVFLLSAAGYFVLPELREPLKVPAGSSMIGAVLSGLLWITAGWGIRLDAPHRRSRKPQSDAQRRAPTDAVPR
jgi:hypothetical protein